MASDGGMQGFVNTFFQAQNLIDQRRQMELMEQNSLAQRTQLAASLANLIVDDEARQALGFVVGGDQELQGMVGQLMQEVAPGANVLERMSALQGFRRAGTERQKELEDVAATRETTGLTPAQLSAEQFQELLMSQDPSDEDLAVLGRMFHAGIAGTTPGRAAQDLAVAGLPEEEHQAIARIAGGLDLSEMERNQIAHWAATNNISLMDLSQRGALGTAGLMLQARAMEMQALASSQGMPAPNTLLDTQRQILLSIGDAQTDAERLTMISVFNNAADLLEGMQLYPAEVGRLPTDPKEVDSGTIRSLQRFWEKLTPWAPWREESLSPGGGVGASPADFLRQQGAGAQPTQELIQFFREQGLISGGDDG